MNTIGRKLLLGGIIWIIPFITSFFVWDIKDNAPAISQEWFNALMAFTWAIGFSIAAFMYFKDAKKKDQTDGWKTGGIWYIEQVALDLVVLVGLFGMTMTNYYPMLLTYLNTVLITGAIGYVRK